MEFVTKGKVKDFFSRNKMRVSVDVYEALNFKVKEFLTRAAERAKKNGRNTVMEQDV